MSKYCGEKNINPIIDAATQWKQRCLIGRTSAFDLGEVWTPENLEQLNTYFVENLDYGEGNFLEKLEGQLAPAKKEAKILCAEAKRGQIYLISHLVFLFDYVEGRIELN